MAPAPHDEHSAPERFRFAPQRLYPLAPDAIGQVFQSRIGPVPIEVRVPESPPHTIEPTTGASTPVQEVPRSTWIVPRSLELTVPARTDPQDAAFGSALRRWWTLTTDWLAAWVGEPPGSDVPVPRLVQPLDADVSDTPTPGGFMRFYGLAGEAHANTTQLARALQLAGDSAELPPAYILVLRAESAHALAEHRVAAMEACSAAEIAADSAIERALTTLGCPETFTEGVVKRARSIRSAHDVLLELNIPCGINKDDVAKLAELRNKAAHGAGRVDWEAAHQAVTVARTLVSTLLGPATPIGPEQR